jgi:hypothetical protein
MTALTVARDKAVLDSGDYDVAQVHEALLYAVVCHRVGLDSQQAIDRACFPAGTTGGWQFVERSDLPEGWWEGDGAANASPTDDHPSTHVHVLAAC